MEPVNVNASVLRNETNNAVVYYHLNKLLASHFDKPPQEIAEASRSAAAAATAAAKAARANANAKAYAAAKAVAAAKAALNLIASFPNQEEEVRKDKHVAEAEAEADAEVDDDGDVLLKDQELASVDASNGMIVPISSPSCEGKEWSSVRLRERPNTEVGSSSRVVESSEDVQKPTRKRGRPRKH